MSSGLLRYRSAPSSLLGELCEDFLPVRPSSPEPETMYARFLSPDLRDEPPSGGGAGGGGPRNTQFPPPSHQPRQLPPLVTSAAAAEENSGGFSSAADAAVAAAAASQMMFQQQQNQMVAVGADQLKNSGGGGGGGGGNCSNLIRHCSSPAGLFSHLNVDNGYGVPRGFSGFRNGNESGGSMGAGSRLKSQLSFSSRQSSSSAGLMSQISEIETESIGGYHPVASWEESPILSDNNFSSGHMRPSHNQPEPQNGEGRNGLTHQFSLPKTSSEMAAIENFLQFQDSVPCRIRAKRGCATHPRSIAERVRRTRISERMRKLQELVPNMDKQTNTADMLDLAVDYIKDLQKQAKSLSDSRASCTCSGSKQKPHACHREARERN